MAKPKKKLTAAQAGPGHYELAKVIPAARKPKLKPAEIDALFVSAALTPKLNWEQFRVLTREP